VGVITVHYTNIIFIASQFCDFGAEKILQHFNSIAFSRVHTLLGKVQSDDHCISNPKFLQEVLIQHKDAFLCDGRATLTH